MGTFSEGSLVGKKEENHQRGCPSSVIFSLHWECSGAERQNCLVHTHWAFVCAFWCTLWVSQLYTIFPNIKDNLIGTWVAHILQNVKVSLQYQQNTLLFKNHDSFIQVTKWQCVKQQQQQWTNTQAYKQKTTTTVLPKQTNKTNRWVVQATL